MKLLVPESVYSIQPLQNPRLPHFTYIQIDYSPLFKNREKILLNKMSHKCSGIHLLPTQNDCVGEIVHLNHTDAYFIHHSLVTHFRKSSWWQLTQITFIIGILFVAFLVDLLLQIKVKIIDALPLCPTVCLFNMWCKRKWCDQHLYWIFWRQGTKSFQSSIILICFTGKQV